MTDEMFMAQYGAQLNDQQREAVVCETKRILLLAVPGSGKTAVLVTRLGYLILCKKIRAENILTMTYTVAATHEMSERFHRLFGNEYGIPEIRTINGLSQKIIACCSEREGRTAFSIEDNDGQLNAIIRKFYREFYPDYPTDSTIRDIRTAITFCKNSLLSCRELGSHDPGLKYFPEIYERYCRYLRSSRKMDYDDQLLYAWNILKTRPAILSEFRRKFPYICVDESQDTSRLQHEIIRLLTGESGNLFLVGDEDQSIYGFRAAWPEALLQFHETYPDSCTLLLEKNYRSTNEIIQAANSFVAANRFRNPKQIIPTCGSGVPVKFVRAIDRAAQYRYILSCVRTEHKPTAILFRNNDSAVPLIDLFERNNISFQCRRFDDVFFSHRIIIDISDIIRFSHNGADTDCFMRIYYKLGCMISRSAAEFACTESRKSGQPILKELLHFPELSQPVMNTITVLYEHMKKLQTDTASKALLRIRFQMGYGSYVDQNQLDAGKFDILAVICEKLSSAEMLLTRLQELRMLIPVHTFENADIILSTIHSAKGLEFDRVCVIDMLDGILPVNSREKTHTAEEIRNYEEDRRLFYVAITRAREELILFLTKNASSEFVDEILHAIGKESFDGNPLLSFLSKNFCGSPCSHKSYGHGTILAQDENSITADFPGTEAIRLTIDELIRCRIPRHETNTPEQPQRTDNFPAEGTKVTHTVFGKGTITSVTADTVAVCFEQDNKTRHFLKSSVISNGKLRPN